MSASDGRKCIIVVKSFVQMQDKLRLGECFDLRGLSKVVEISGWRHATVRRKLLLYRALIGRIAELTEGRRGIAELVGFEGMASRGHRSHVTGDGTDAWLEAVVERIVVHSTHVGEAALILNGILGLWQTSTELPRHGYLARRRHIVRGDLTARGTTEPTLAIGTHNLALNPSSVRRLTDSW